MRLLLILAATMLCGGWPRPAAAEPFEVLHVLANTGGSAGGHVALRIGDHVFHYQAGRDMLLYLHRDAWPDFVNRYAVIDNRAIEASIVAIDDGDREAIRRRLEQLHLAQLQHHARLEALELQAVWTLARSGKDVPVSLDAAGLFATSTGDDPSVVPSAGVVERYGDGFLAAAVATADAKLASFLPDEVVEPPQPGVYFEHASSAEELRELLAWREGLRVLRDARPLHGKVLRRPDVMTLTAAERDQLRSLHATLRGNILRLLQSPRPDRGRALLASIARYQSVGMSLREDRLVLVDTNPLDAVLYDEHDIHRHRKLLRTLEQQNQATWHRIRNEAFAGTTINEWQLAALEDAATKYTEIRSAALDGNAIRIFEPNLTGSLRAGDIAVEPAGITEGAPEIARATADEYRSALYEVYGYDLISHNCSTELLAALQWAASGEPIIAERFEADGMTFIPAVLAGAATRNWNVSGTYRIPSFREWRVAQKREQENDMLVAVRESNRLTASVYDGSMLDDAFLFFADGAPVLRPFQGIGNLAWSAGHTVMGLLALPFDGARRAQAGLSGMFYSAPELIGFNIRKGRYDVAPPDAAQRLLEAAE